MFGVSSQYANGLETRIAELEAQIADDASVNAEIDKRLKAHDDAVTAKDEIIDELKYKLAGYESQARQMFGIIEARDRRIAELEKQNAKLAQMYYEGDPT